MAVHLLRAEAVRSNGLVERASEDFPHAHFFPEIVPPIKLMTFTDSFPTGDNRPGMCRARRAVLRQRVNQDPGGSWELHCCRNR